MTVCSEDILRWYVYLILYLYTYSQSFIISVCACINAVFGVGRGMLMYELNHINLNARIIRNNFVRNLRQIFSGYVSLYLFLVQFSIGINLILKLSGFSFNRFGRYGNIQHHLNTHPTHVCCSFFVLGSLHGSLMK